MQTEPVQDKLLTSREAGEFLNYSEYTMRRARLDGRLAGKHAPKVTMIGKAVRYRQSDLDIWVNESND